MHIITHCSTYQTVPRENDPERYIHNDYVLRIRTRVREKYLLDPRKRYKMPCGVVSYVCELARARSQVTPKRHRYYNAIKKKEKEKKGTKQYTKGGAALYICTPCT